MNEITRLLNGFADGSMSSRGVLPEIYRQLQQLAAGKIARERAGITLQTSDLVHEAWLRLGGDSKRWENRAHFFSAAAEAMRRILIDRARSKRAARHGGGREHLDIGGVDIAAPAEDTELLEVDEALEKLAVVHPQRAELVKLRYFAGLRMEEAATVLGFSRATAERHWALARVWLYREIQQARGK